ncbi:hypothetical protein GCM10009688_01430 [Arthrobacter gandavensis]|uniref:Uncharacterized protein n=1 Tax=Arthrobacter gandavensis TaxID=169960 RepID=A0ABN2NWA5_9MICC
MTSQDTSSELTLNSRGYSGSSGTTAVFSNDTVIPPSAMMVVTSQAGDLLPRDPGGMLWLCWDTGPPEYPRAKKSGRVTASGSAALSCAVRSG